MQVAKVGQRITRSTPQLISVLPGWRESGLFTRVEQTSLAIAEAVTTFSRS